MENAIEWGMRDDVPREERRDAKQRGLRKPRDTRVP
jgi:hypothetical protein